MRGGLTPYNGLYEEVPPERGAFLCSQHRKGNVNTVKPRFNEVPRDGKNWFVKSRVRYFEVCFS